MDVFAAFYLYKSSSRVVFKVLTSLQGMEDLGMVGMRKQKHMSMSIWYGKTQPCSLTPSNNSYSYHLHIPPLTWFCEHFL